MSNELTKDQLEVYAAYDWENRKNYDERSKVMAIMARQLLAGMQQAPFAWTDEEEAEDVQKGSYGNMFNGDYIEKHDGRWFPIYRHPIAPVLKPIILPRLCLSATTKGEREEMQAVREDDLKAIRAAGYPVEVAP